MADEKKQEVPTYPAERLTAEASARFGEPPHVVAGAIASLPGSRKNFTEAEIEDAIKKWKRHPVEVDNPIGVQAGEEA